RPSTRTGTTSRSAIAPTMPHMCQPHSLFASPQLYLFAASARTRPGAGRTPLEPHKNLSIQWLECWHAICFRFWCKTHPDPPPRSTAMNATQPWNTWSVAGFVRRLREQVKFGYDDAALEGHGRFDVAQVEQSLINLLRNAHE